MKKRGTGPTNTVPHAVVIIPTIAIAIMATNCLMTVATNVRSTSERLRRSFLANLATSMATRPSTPMRSDATIPKIAKQAAEIVTTTESIVMMHTTTTTMTNATSVATTSLQTMNIARQSRAMMNRNQVRAAKTASVTKEITMSALVKYLKKVEGRCGQEVCTSSEVF